MRALKASLRPQATARRDGVWQTLDAAALVPGDLVLLASGSHVPADCKARAPPCAVAVCCAAIESRLASLGSRRHCRAACMGGITRAHDRTVLAVIVFDKYTENSHDQAG